MLLSTKDQGLGRRRRSYSHSSVYSMSKPGRSSKLSLLSAITTQSSGSNGSNSTVTQESYNKSKGDGGRKKRSSKRKKDVTKPKSVVMDAVEEAISEEEESTRDVDVFEFLVEETEDPESSDEYDRQTPPSHGPTQEKEASSQSFYSDSGISIDDGSLVLGQTAMKPLLPTMSAHDTIQHDSPSLARFDWQWPQVPRPNQPTILPVESSSPWDQLFSPSDHHAGPHSPHPYCLTPESPRSRRASLSVPQRLSSELTNLCIDSTSFPLKTFSRTCSRLLLEMQQSIAGLEEELRRLDPSYTGTNDSVSSSSTQPDTGQWKQHPSNLAILKGDLVERLQLKMQQYCRPDFHYSRKKD
jgi:hypothetical protein